MSAQQPPNPCGPDSVKLKAVAHRWHRALVNIGKSLLSRARRQRIVDAGQRAQGPTDLDGADVNTAEIRFVVHKPGYSSYPRLDPVALDCAGDVELVWELRRLIAWSGGTIADVARALETRGADLDSTARELLQDEVAALESDLDAVSVHLADPVDWDSEFGCLLAGEVAPFDDLADDDDDESNG